MQFTRMDTVSTESVTVSYINIYINIIKYHYNACFLLLFPPFAPMEINRKILLKDP